MSTTGIKNRRVDTVTILDADPGMRIALRFGGSSVPLPAAVDSLIADGQNRILLNLGGVAIVDARGLGDLVSTFVAVNKTGGQFKLFNLTQVFRELMMTTKLLAVFEVYENELQAIDGFKNDTFAPAQDEVNVVSQPF